MNIYHALHQRALGRKKTFFSVRQTFQLVSAVESHSEYRHMLHTDIISDIYKHIMWQKRKPVSNTCLTAQGFYCQYCLPF